jgi:hypothetical protein
LTALLFAGGERAKLGIVRKCELYFHGGHMAEKNDDLVGVLNVVGEVERENECEKGLKDVFGLDKNKCDFPLD